MVELTNEHLTVQISSHGAELCSIRGNASGREYLWQADPTYWKRHSPVLFPIVGSVWENRYHHAGQSYALSQHGFARDMDFELVSQSETEVLFRLESNAETLAKYPFPFRLEIGYQLIRNQVKVLWAVYNPVSTDLYFQIGAHPAFYYPNYTPEDSERGYFAFDKTDALSYILIAEKGCVSPDTYPLHLQEGLLPLDTTHLRPGCLDTGKRASERGTSIGYKERGLSLVAILGTGGRPLVSSHQKRSVCLYRTLVRTL